MRSSSVIRNLIVLCAYTIYQSMEAYPLYCEIGIAVAIAVLQIIVDNTHKFGRISNETTNIGPVSRRPFEVCSCNKLHFIADSDGDGAKNEHGWLNKSHGCTVFDGVMPLCSNNRIVLISTKINKAFQLLTIIRDLVDIS